MYRLCAATTHHKIVLLTSDLTNTSSVVSIIVCEMISGNLVVCYVDKSCMHVIAEYFLGNHVSGTS